MLLSPRKNGLTPLIKEDWVFKVQIWQKKNPGFSLVKSADTYPSKNSTQQIAVVPPSVAKTCVVRAVLAWAAGELRAADPRTLKPLTFLDKEVSDHSIWRYWKLFWSCDQSIWSIWVRCPQILVSLRTNGQEEPRLLSLRRLRS